MKSAEFDGAVHRRSGHSPPGAPAFAGTTRKALALAVALAAAPIAAQGTDGEVVVAEQVIPTPAPRTGELQRETDRIVAAMPRELDGAPVRDMSDGLWMYAPKGPSGQPMVVGTLVVEKDGVYSAEEMKRLSRKLAGDKGRIRKILREGAFASPKWPGAATFFGDYEAGQFSHQHWILMTGRHAITVFASYDRKKDGARAEALVRDRIFGGAVIRAEKPAE